MAIRRQSYSRNARRKSAIDLANSISRTLPAHFRFPSGDSAPGSIATLATASIAIVSSSGATGVPRPDDSRIAGPVFRSAGAWNSGNLPRRVIVARFQGAVLVEGKHKSKITGSISEAVTSGFPSAPFQLEFGR